MASIRNIGIFAHVDAGKTTLSEQLLLHSGAIRTAGSVDSGTAHTDLLPVERRRGISVKASCVRFSWRDIQVNLIDTPGHTDFSAEIERSLWALDGAIMVVCAVEGVQPQTEVLYRAMEEQKLPVLFFINKTDRAGADIPAVVKQLSRLTGGKSVVLAEPDSLLEALCDVDEQILEGYINETSFRAEELYKSLCVHSRRGELFPVLSGCALRGQGIRELMDAITDCLPEPHCIETLSGVVFAAQQDRALGRGVWIRLFGGHLENRMSLAIPNGIDPATGAEKAAMSKITQIQSPAGTPEGSLPAGQIGLVFGLGDVPIGHILGDPSQLIRPIISGKLRTPLITVQAVPEKSEDMTALRQACRILSGEDPMLKQQFIRSKNQLHLQVMGTIQLEVLQEVLQTRFGLNVRFLDPAIIYRETVAHPAEGFVAYTVPKPCWAILKFTVEPAPRGSGIRFSSKVPVRELAAHYQNQVAQALPLALSQGRMGWEVTDVKITLTEGNSHQFHTHPLDFIVATPMAIHDGLQRGGTQLLEPILQIRFLLPQDCVGRVISDVSLMRGEVLDTQTDGDRVIVNALVPVQSSLDYSVTLASATGGRGAMSARLHGYRECPAEFSDHAPRRGVDPLDTAKYILAARSALEGGIFDT